MLFTSLLASNAWSADVPVAPGVDTLSAALAAASHGDTLILETGTYSGAVTVNKSLTIRANTNNADALVSGSFVIAGAGIEVVVQGLDFSTNIDVNAAGDVKILQNTFLNGADIDVTDYKTSEDDGSLAVIGNHLTQNGDIGQIHSNDAYIAGNVLDIGLIDARAPVWIVGNTVSGYGGASPATPLVASPGTGIVQVIGNRVTMNGGGNHSGIGVTASRALIAGNIVRVNQDPSGGNGGIVRGINSSGGTYATVINNIVYRGIIGVSVNSENDGIRTSGRIIGNIVRGLSGIDFHPIRGSGGSVVATNNLCFNNRNNATCGTSPIQADPNFQADSFHLAEGSPAIDAGPEAFAFSDFDRTRNDIGAYGGPWNIEQYDAQRDPTNFGPYVFPLFKADSAFSDGSIEVRALGVARLR